MPHNQPTNDFHSTIEVDGTHPPTFSFMPGLSRISSNRSMPPVPCEYSKCNRLVTPSSLKPVRMKSLVSEPQGSTAGTRSGSVSVVNRINVCPKCYERFRVASESSARGKSNLNVVATGSSRSHIPSSSELLLGHAYVIVLMALKSSGHHGSDQPIASSSVVDHGRIQKQVSAAQRGKHLGLSYSILTGQLTYNMTCPCRQPVERTGFTNCSLPGSYATATIARAAISPWAALELQFNP